VSAGALGQTPLASERDQSARTDFLIYLGKKVAAALMSFAFLLVAGYLIFSVLPANPLEALTRGRPVSAAQIAFLKQQLGLNQPAWERFGDFVWHTLHGNLGYSWQFGEPVSTLIAQRLWPTLLLMGTATGWRLGCRWRSGRCRRSGSD
jgi:peptide/nickel transport system permease protein